jgi:hypothetical protein
MTKHSSLIPNYITAKSLLGLRRLMYLTNAKYGMQLQYFDISQFVDENGKKSWVAWYYINLEDLGELDNGNAVELSGSGAGQV